MNISINEPCHENWSKMKAGNGSKFCNSCQKNVIDFTLKSDKEIIDYFITHANENTCGRFNKSQINKPSDSFLYSAYVKFKTISQSKNNLWGLIISFGAMVLASCNNSVKGKPELNKNTDTIKVDHSNDTMGAMILEPIETIHRTKEFIDIENIVGKVESSPTKTELGDITILPDSLINVTQPKSTVDFNTFVNENVIMPKSIKDSVLRNAKVSFVVKSDGSISEVKILKSTGNLELDNEAIRLVSIQPKYLPGKRNGIAADVLCKINIVFE